MPHVVDIPARCRRGCCVVPLLLRSVAAKTNVSVVIGGRLGLQPPLSHVLLVDLRVVPFCNITFSHVIREDTPSYKLRVAGTKSELVRNVTPNQGLISAINLLIAQSIFIKWRVILTKFSLIFRLTDQPSRTTSSLTRLHNDMIIINHVLFSQIIKLVFAYTYVYINKWEHIICTWALWIHTVHIN
jgi:hypothetical protein